MADWRLAKSLETLRTQVNAAAPHRSKAEDGTIGDAAHASRTSDHNINSAGVVCALDLTHDPAGGFDSYQFADVLRQQRDERIKYVISNKKIFYGPRSPSYGGSPSQQWKWMSYTGANPHDKHVHISVGDSRYYDKTDPWQFAGWPGTLPLKEKPLLKKGSVGADVVTLQQLLGIEDDGIFGSQTDAAVRQYQQSHGLMVDGIVGPQTWGSLLGTSGSPDWRTGITATEFGGPSDFNRSAYDNHVITATELGVALPYRFTGSRPQVMVRKSSQTVTCTIVDIGPWMTNDPYWQTGSRPIAETCYHNHTALPSGPNQGRVPSNPAGIDLTPAVARALSIDGKGIIDWRFAQAAPLAAATAPKEAPVAPVTRIDPEPASEPPAPPAWPPTQEQFMVGVRWLLATAGPSLISYGYVSSETWAQVAGAIIAVAPLVWGAYTSRRSGLIKKAAALPEVKEIVAAPAISEGTLKEEPKVVSK